jgi:hypothetical protein
VRPGCQMSDPRAGSRTETRGAEGLVPPDVAPARPSDV